MATACRLSSSSRSSNRVVYLASEKREAARASLLVPVADPCQPDVQVLVQVPCQIGAPVAEAGQADCVLQSFHTRPLADPFGPVALRKSTTRRERSASCS